MSTPKQESNNCDRTEMCKNCWYAKTCQVSIEAVTVQYQEAQDLLPFYLSEPVYVA